MVATFAIVTPTFNSARYLSETIASIVGQAGDFYIEHHIQDGGSTDATTDIVARWQELIAYDRVTILCRGVRLTWASEQDRGMYDAVNRGFAAIDPGQAMTWINSDDRLMQGSLATVAAILDDVPDIAWLGGRVSLIDERGCSLGVNPPQPYRSAAIARGTHDGRRKPFLMQEGIFWRPDLWRRAGGLDARFRLAGDWDLWRRFARHTDFATVDTVLGVHRRRRGQLSEDMDRYYSEVDRALADDMDARGGADPSNAPEHPGAAGSIVRYDFASAHWIRSTELADPARRPAFVITAETRKQTLPVEVIEGASAPEGPYPQVDLFDPVRWIEGSTLKGRVICRRPGRWMSVLECRVWTAGLRLVATIEDQTLFDGELPARGHDQEIMVRFPTTLIAGTNLIAVSLHGHRPAAIGEVLLVRWAMEPIHDNDPESATTKQVVAECSLTDRMWAARVHDVAGDRPTLSVIVIHEGTAGELEKTLTSIDCHTYLGIDTVVVSRAPDPRARELLGRYRRSATVIVVPETSPGGKRGLVDNGFAASTGELVCWLRAGDLLPSDIHRLGGLLSEPTYSDTEAFFTRATKDRRRRVRSGILVHRSSFAGAVLNDRGASSQQASSGAIAIHDDRTITTPSTVHPDRPIGPWIARVRDPGSKGQARHRLGLPADAFILLCRSRDCTILAAPELSIAAIPRRLVIVIPDSSDPSATARQEWPWPARIAGSPNDEAVRILHLAAADVVLDRDSTETLASEAASVGTASVYCHAATAAAMNGGLAVADDGEAIDAVRRLHDLPQLRRQLAARGWLSFTHEPKCVTDVVPSLGDDLAWIAGPDTELRASDGGTRLVPIGKNPTILVYSPVPGLGFVTADLLLGRSAVLWTATMGGEVVEIRSVEAFPPPDPQWTMAVRAIMACKLDAGYNALMLDIPGAPATSPAWSVSSVTVMPPWPDFGVEREEVVEDGEWRPLTGFSFPEGPYPELNLPHSFRWTFGRDIFFRIFAAVSGTRTLFMSVRNILPGQCIALQLEGQPARSFALLHDEITKRNWIEMTAEFAAGWTDICMAPRILSDGDQNGRRLAALVDRIGFASPPA